MIGRNCLVGFFVFKDMLAMLGLCSDVLCELALRETLPVRVAVGVLGHDGVVGQEVALLVGVSGAVAGASARQTDFLLCLRAALDALRGCSRACDACKAQPQQYHSISSQTCG
jgi:hypothetical protein